MKGGDSCAAAGTTGTRTAQHELPSGLRTTGLPLDSARPPLRSAPASQVPVFTWQRWSWERSRSTAHRATTSTGTSSR
eukprot:10540238-Lingulodinium_polyedra.AAC.1